MGSFFAPEHDAYRGIVRDFIARRITGEYADWEASGQIPAQLWGEAARLGLLGLDIGPEHGGVGLDDWRFRMVVIEELGWAGASAVNSVLAAQDDLVVPALLAHGSPAQQAAWLPAMAAGTALGAVAITEPGAGSDLRALRTTAVADGDGWVLNGQKAFVSNGQCAEVVLLAALTGPGERAGLTLFLVAADTPGMERGRRLDKLGLHAQDTIEFFLTDVRVPADAVLGQAGEGLQTLKDLLVRERLALAAVACATASGALGWAVEQVFARRVFGQRLGDLQHTRFALAEMETGLDVTRSYLRECAARLNEGSLTGAEAAKAKWWAGEQAQQVVTGALQLFGGYGFMEEYPIARLFRDARVLTLYGGTTEVLKDIIGRDIAARRR